MTPAPRRSLRLAVLATIGLLLASAHALPAAGQERSWGWASMAEGAGDGVLMVHAKVTRFTAEAGLHAALILAAHQMWSDVDNAWSLHPRYGVEYRHARGRAQLDVGYSFRREEDLFPFFAGSRSGPTTGLELDLSVGERVSLRSDAAAYWHSTFVWSRLLAMGRATRFADGATLDVGADLVWQSEWESDVPGLEYRARQLGAALQWSDPRGFAFVAGAGLKQDTFRPHDTGYVRVELRRGR